MRGRRWAVPALTVCLLAGGSFAGAAPAGAAAAAGQQAEPSAPALISAAAAEDARNRVRKMAMSSLPDEIRSSAWLALRSSRGDAAIAEWLAPGGGFQKALQRMRTTQNLNRAFCERVLLTHPASFSPEVHAAAERAVAGTPVDQAAFVRSGYDAALKRDRAAREADEKREAEVAARDRDFVRNIAENDPGEQVRVAARWALRPGAGDADVAEFFGYGWTTGATLDLEGYRMRIADAEVARHHTLSLLLEKATAAEEALKSAADKAKARAEAERAWGEVADHADAARKAWLAERDTAVAQAENWRNVAKASKDSADRLWKNIGDAAAANQDSWTGEQTEAAGTAGFWKDMFDRAQDSEDRVKG
ncbi:hypothetical protein I5Q34_01995 [Streptomyces sp. AV19]|uniref:hypothetical protein n=1 Tax=Streptomyces sp. AV19 TaxID=2793068 RepID=UPI0018FEC7C2|nr:hypothetical protein [Streptomyces sp. AV19]MBH1933073.1 hypothetical protein [Streptomyces sp. AV19]MDG4531785.1 hypothetical protein [Streptomyces sp. AV19]